MTTGRSRRACRRVLVGAFLVAALGGCAPEPTLDAGWPSSERALATLVLEAFASADTASLRRLRLSEHEHNAEVWPQLPAATSGSGYTAELAWANIELRDQRAVRRNLEWFAGREVRLDDASCRGPVEEFATFRVHTDCWVRFETAEGMAEAQLYKDVLERDGRFKLFRFYDEGVRLLEAR